jgi:carnitine 3-dehydrogenase
MSRLRGSGQIKRVAVVGAGLIGRGWAAAFLARGLEVVVHDPAPDAALAVRAHVAAAWPDLVELGLAKAKEMPRLLFEPTLEAAVEAADFVQENGPERPDLKRNLFTRIDAAAAPDVVIASSTSGLPISELQANCTHPERCVLGHPFNPVHLMPLVEIGGGRRTDLRAIEAALSLYLSMGKEPVRVNREVGGHIANRLTSAMFREAVSLVEQGYATVEDVDRAIRFGPALKWAIQGQFTTFHTSGGEGGLAGFLKHFAAGISSRWATMETPDLSDPVLQARLVEQMAAATDGRAVSEIAEQQDRQLLELLNALQSSGGALIKPRR